MSDTIFAVPVKYMVIGYCIPKLYKVIDTSFEGDGKTVWKWLTLRQAHNVCRLLNQYEGFHYG